MKPFIIFYPPYAGRFFLKSRPPFPIGPLYIAAYLDGRGVPARVVDYGHPYTDTQRIIPNGPSKKVSVHGLDMVSLVSDLNTQLENCHDVVGVSSLMSTSYYTAYEIVGLIKKLAPDKTVIVGGPHATIFPEHILANTKADYVCLGEGEEPMYDFLTKGSHPSIVNRTTLLNKRRVYHHKNLDELPFPELIHLQPPRKTEMMMVTFSRGCPMSCEFCTSHLIQGRLWRHKSPEVVIQEIKHYHKEWGVRKFEIEDDNLCPGTAGINWLLQLCGYIIENKRLGELSSNVRFHVPHGIPVKSLSDKSLCDTIWSAGFRDMVFPLESTNPEVLNDMNKHVTHEDWITATRNWSFETNHPTEIILGYPFVETIETMLTTMMDIARNKSLIWASHFRLNHGTRLFDRCVEAGYVNADYDPLSMNAFFVETEQFTIADLKELMAIARGVNYGTELGFDVFHDDPTTFVSKPYRFVAPEPQDKVVATGSFSFRRNQTAFTSLVLSRYGFFGKPLTRISEDNTSILYTGHVNNRVYHVLNLLLKKNNLLLASRKGIRKFVN